MRPNANQLAMRDPALASIMGALPGSDFGYGGRSRRAVQPRRQGTASFGDFGFGFGDDYGFGAEPPRLRLPPRRPSAARRCTPGTTWAIWATMAIRASMQRPCGRFVITR